VSGTEIAAANRGQKVDGPRPNSFRRLYDPSFQKFSPSLLSVSRKLVKSVVMWMQSGIFKWRRVRCDTLIHRSIGRYRRPCCTYKINPLATLARYFTTF